MDVHYHWRMDILLHASMSISGLVEVPRQAGGSGPICPFWGRADFPQIGGKASQNSSGFGRGKREKRESKKSGGDCKPGQSRKSRFAEEITKAALVFSLFSLLIYNLL